MAPCARTRWRRFTVAIVVASRLFDGHRRRLRFPRKRPVYRGHRRIFCVRTWEAVAFRSVGPLAFFIVLVAATVAKFGVEGLLVAVLLSGLTLTLIGLLRLGSLTRPHSRMRRWFGFTGGIVITRLVSQIKDLGGNQTLAGVEPGPLFPKLAMLCQALPTGSPAAFAVGVGSGGSDFLLRHWRPTWPGMLIAVVTASIAASLLRLLIKIIGSYFGGLAHLRGNSPGDALRVKPPSPRTIPRLLRGLIPGLMAQ